jgi:hypothetical protein
VYKNVLFVMLLRMSGATRMKVLEGMSIGKSGGLDVGRLRWYRQKFNASISDPQVPAVCKDCVDAG